MRQVLTTEENALVSSFKQSGIFQRFTTTDLRDLANADNGGVAIICSDGDIDAFAFHARISSRPHAIKIFGGPLVLSPIFRGHDKGFTRGLINNLKQGMRAKKTETIFLYFHYPCGLAIEFRYEIHRVVAIADRIREVFADDKFFNQEKIFTFFHVKRINKAGNLEQNTYQLASL